MHGKLGSVASDRSAPEPEGDVHGWRGHCRGRRGRHPPAHQHGASLGLEHNGRAPLTLMRVPNRRGDLGDDLGADLGAELDGSLLRATVRLCLRRPARTRPPPPRHAPRTSLERHSRCPVPSRSHDEHSEKLSLLTQLAQRHAQGVGRMHARPLLSKPSLERLPLAVRAVARLNAARGVREAPADAAELSADEGHLAQTLEEATDDIGGKSRLDPLRTRHGRQRALPTPHCPPDQRATRPSPDVDKLHRDGSSVRRLDGDGAHAHLVRRAF